MPPAESVEAAAARIEEEMETTPEALRDGLGEPARPDAALRPDPEAQMSTACGSARRDWVP